MMTAQYYAYFNKCKGRRCVCRPLEGRRWTLCGCVSGLTGLVLGEVWGYVDNLWYIFETCFFCFIGGGGGVREEPLLLFRRCKKKYLSSNMNAIAWLGNKVPQTKKGFCVQSLPSYTWSHIINLNAWQLHTERPSCYEATVLKIKLRSTHCCFAWFKLKHIVGR